MRARPFIKWAKTEDATTAIEFSMLAVPFMLMVVGIIEMALLFTAGVLLQGGVGDAARLVKTGQLQAMGSEDDQREAFLDAVCEQAQYLMECDDLQYQLIRLDSFNDDTTPQVDEDGNMVDPELFDIGEVTAGCTALIRITYLYPLLTPFFGDIFGNYGRSRLLVATAAFETEPYEFDTAEECE